MIDLGPTHATQVAPSSCRISLVLLHERAGAPYSLTVHFTEQKKTCVVHGSLLLLRILFTELVVLILTNKGLLKTISWHIMQLIKAKCHETKT